MDQKTNPPGQPTQNPPVDPNNDPFKPGVFKNNYYAYLYDEEENKKNKDITLNTNEPEKSMVCWNCLSVLTVKPTWGIIQCPNCDKFNRVPDCDEGEKLKLKLDKNNLDIVSPYVYVVLTCPYCKEDNKVKKETEHVVCCNCYNSFSIENPTIKFISSKKPVTINNKVTRVSDINFPDPMFFRGYYPQPNPCVEVPCQGCMNGCYGANSDLVGDLTQEIMKENYRRPIRERVRVKADPYDKWSALRKMIKDVGEIENQRNVDMNINGRINSSIYSMPKDMNDKITYNPNPKNIYGNNGRGGSLDRNGPSANFYKRYNTPVPNLMVQNKNAEFINKMMFTSWNNH